MAHICVRKLTIIDSDNGLLPGRRQVIIWAIARILLIRTLGTNFTEILKKIHAFSFKIIHLKMSSANWRQYWIGRNVLSVWQNGITFWMMAAQVFCSWIGWPNPRGKCWLYLIKTIIWLVMQYLVTSIAWSYLCPPPPPPPPPPTHTHTPTHTIITTTTSTTTTNT